MYESTVNHMITTVRHLGLCIATYLELCIHRVVGLILKINENTYIKSIMYIKNSL